MTAENISKNWELTNLQHWQEQSLLHGQKKWAATQKKALADFIEQGFPTRKIENWKYTNLTALAESEFNFKKAADSFPSKSHSDFYQIQFHNGQFLGVSNTEDLPKAVVITNLKSVLGKIENFELPEIYKTVFSDLNMALLDDGVFIYIPKGIELGKTIHLIYSNDQGIMNNPRNFIFLKENSRANFLVEYSSENAKIGFNNIVEQVYLAAHSRLNYYKFQNESTDFFHISNMVAELQQEAHLRCYHFAVGSRIARDDINIDLQGRAAQCELYGLYMPDQTRLIDFHTRIDHVAPHSQSQQLYKTITSDKARAVFNGKVVVAQDAQKISAQQKSANLLMSKNAEVDAKPELEIYADDVQCTHGATIGQLDETALFYLRSRGIDQLTAKKMLTDAFSREILDLIDNEVIAKYMDEVLC